MDKTKIAELRELYRSVLLKDVVPFWLKHSLDREFGGYLTCLDRDGSVYCTDKYMWMQAREVWMFSTLYRQIENNPQWLSAAKSGADFLMKFGFDKDDRMPFIVSRDGTPLHRPWNIFTEYFGVIGLAAYGKSSGDKKCIERAEKTYWMVQKLLRNPEEIVSHLYPTAPDSMSHAVSMVNLAMTMELDKINPDPRFETITSESVQDICFKFARDKERALFETVGLNGERLDSPAGRCINPGHALESAWFVMEYAMEHNKKDIIERAADIVEWSLKWGWDEKYGGILYYVDCESRPPEQLEWDMKLWWVHCEALYALLLSYYLTQRDSLLDWYEKVHKWTFSHFPDPEFGEWFGYLHRDGSPSLMLKGSGWKCMFHLPRALLNCMKILEKML